ncbi:MAG: glycosyltransferase family 4 protein [Chloroflexi bacterium]|nr:glycosyltransferase family 4 protein [Chloroflexota bacterium]MBP8054540.1 glycosyltransferase family 4 protein [Chloroflexota bacterium]
MKIVHLTPNYFPSIGGIQTIFKNVSERLVAQYNDEVIVLTTNAIDSVHGTSVKYLSVTEDSINGVAVRRFSFSRRWVPILKRLILLGRYLPIPGLPYMQLWRTGPVSSSMKGAIRNIQADVILAAPFNYLHMYYPQRGRTPLVYMGALHLTEAEFVHPMIIRAINQANAYIAFTSYERDVLLRRGVKPEKLHVIGLGIDLEQFQRANGQIIRQELGLGDEPVVAYLGRLASYKGVDTLILAMQKIWLTMPQTRLLIAGAQTDFVLSLQTMINNLPVAWQERIIFKRQPFTPEDAPHLFAASDVFVTVSSAESFGIVYLEAWACRKPVIGGRIKAVASVIAEGEDGLLVECGNVDQLSDALLQLLQNPELRVAMGEKGYKKVTGEYTWDIVTQKIRQVYQAVV